MNEPDFKEFVEKYLRIEPGTATTLHASKYVAEMMKEIKKSGGKPIRLRLVRPGFDRSQEALQPGWFSMMKTPEHGEPGHQSGACGKCNTRD